MSDCVFCDIIARKAPAKIITRGLHSVVFEPLNPVTNGHVLVVPRRHVADFTEDPKVTARTMRYASRIAYWVGTDFNLITSKGVNATQTVPHFHVHLVPRSAGDGLALPWTGQHGGDDG